MPPYEINSSDLYLMNENGDAVKITGFLEMPKCEVEIDPSINLKSLCESKFEGSFQLTPESEAELKKLQEQLNAEIIENLKEQIVAVSNVITAMEFCGPQKDCNEKCPYRGEFCIARWMKDAIAIVEAYKNTIEKGLKMMEEKS